MTSRSFLWLGEEGGIFYEYQGQKQVRREILEDLEDLKSLVSEGAALEILVDTCPQRFAQGSLPRSFFWNRKKLLSQKLKHLFAPEDLWAGIWKTKNSFHGICLERSGTLGAVLQVLGRDSILLRGVSSFAFEAGDFFLGAQVLVSLTERGNLRQIFFQDGQALLCRYRKLPEGAYDPGLIEVEVSATLTYLERQFSVPRSSIAVKGLVKSGGSCPFPKHWSIERARGLSIEDHFVELYLKKSKPACSLLPKEFRRSWQAFQGTRALKGLMLVLALGFCLWGSSLGLQVWEAREEGHRLLTETQSLGATLERYKKNPNFDRERRLYGLISGYRAGLGAHRDPLGLLHSLHRELEKGFWVSSFEWSAGGVFDGEEVLPRASMTVNVRLRDPSLSLEEARDAFTDFTCALRQIFPDYKVEDLACPYDLGEHQILKGAVRSQDAPFVYASSSEEGVLRIEARGEK